MKVSTYHKVLPGFIRVPLAIFARRLGITTWLNSRKTKKEIQALAEKRSGLSLKPEGAKVLIVCAHYNHLTFLDECVNSILSQNYENWELVIVDDQTPNDRTLEQLNIQSAKDSRIKAIQLTENSGAYIARNTGVEAASNDWTHITFIDPDDIAMPHFLSHALSVLNGREGSVRPVLERWNEDLTKYKSTYFGYCPSLHSRIAWERAGGFLPVRVSGDSELISRMHFLSKDGKTIVEKGHLTAQRCRLLPGSASHQKLKDRKIWLENKFAAHSKMTPQELFVLPKTAHWKSV